MGIEKTCDSPECLTLSRVTVWTGDAKAGAGNAGVSRQHIIGRDSCRLKPVFLAKDWRFQESVVPI